MERQMDIYQTRRENLRRYIEEKGHGAVLHVAMKLGYSNGSYLSQMIGPNPRRTISEKVAREIEKKLGLAHGFLDRPAASDSPRAPAPAETAIADIGGDAARILEGIQRMTELVGRTVQAHDMHPSPEQFADMVRAAFELGEATGHVNDQGIAERLARIAGHTPKRQ